MMYGSKRSGIPVAGSAAKSSIPVVKKTTRPNQATNKNISTKSNSSPERRGGSPLQASKVSDLPNDPKILKPKIIELQKKLEQNEGALSELNDKLAIKNEECDDLAEEKETMRMKNSLDLQQITSNYLELQEEYRQTQMKTAQLEEDYQQEQERLQLELQVAKGEHELELSMLRKEIIDIRNKSQPLDAETKRLKHEYESEIDSLKKELQEQRVKTQDSIEKLEQQEFELLELQETKKQYQRQIEVIAAEHEAEILRVKETIDTQGKGAEENSETSIKTLTEHHERDISILREKLKEEQLENEKQMSLRKEMENQVKYLEEDLEQSAQKCASLEKLHKKEIEEMKIRYESELQRMQLQQKSGSDWSRSSENDLQMKRQIEAYEHEIRILKADLKKERLDFTQAREMLENNITEMEQEMKEREEKVRWELTEEHKYEIENMLEEHQQSLHEKQKAHKQEMTELRKTYEAQSACSIEKGSEIQHALDQQNIFHKKDLEDAKAKYDNEVEILQEKLESLQMEHEELQTEYDLVVNDLEGELEVTKMKVRGGHERRRNSGALLEEKRKINEDAEQHMKAELKKAQSIISSLNNEIADLKAKEKTTLEHLEKVTKLEALVRDLEMTSGNQDDLEKELNELKLLNNKLQNEVNENHGENFKLQTEIECIKNEKNSDLASWEAKMQECESKFIDLQKEKETLQVQRDLEVETLESKIISMRQQKEEQQRVDNENISILTNSNEKLKDEKKMLEDEVKKLRTENELELASNSDSQIYASENTSVYAERVDLMSHDAPEPTEGLKVDQQMKAIVEDFENKINDLQNSLNKANQELASKNSRIESFKMEINLIQENLENERNMVQNLEERCQKILQNRDAEIENVRKSYESRAAQSSHENADNNAKLRQEYDIRIEEVRNELDKVSEEKNNLASETDVLRKKQVALEKKLMEQESKHLQEKNAEKESYNLEISQLHQELSTVNEKLEQVQSNLNEERSEHNRKVEEKEFLVKQLRESESNSDRIQGLVNEIQKLQEENSSLRSDISSKKAKFTQQADKLRKEGKSKTAEIECLAAMIDKERTAHKDKLEELENIVRKRDEEIKTLSEMLEKEQANHEQTIRDTHKHVGKLQDLEAKNDEFNRENLLLKLDLRELKNKKDEIEQKSTNLEGKLVKVQDELSKVHQDNDELLNRNKKIANDEIEQVQKLNRSLTEAEIHKGKLLGAFETSKHELQKTQEKYQKTRDKLRTVKQKWQEDHCRLEEILYSPRVEMGLQTSLIEPQDLEKTQNQLSTTLKINAKLEDELNGSKRSLHEFRNDMQAMKRANNVLIKQNQVLYVETESLKKTVETLTDKSDQLRQMSVKLSADNESLKKHNIDLEEKLQNSEKNLKHIESERHSFDALNKSSQFELEEQKNTCRKIEQENEQLKNQNEFLLSQAKRLQGKVDELEGNEKQLKDDLLKKEVEILKKERIVSDLKSQSETALVPMMPKYQAIQPGPQYSRSPDLAKESELIVSKAEESNVSPTPFKDVNGNDFDKGYVGVKSYQLIEWDVKKDPGNQLNSSETPSLAKIKQLEFDSNNYLGSAYWDAMKLLKSKK